MARPKSEIRLSDTAIDMPAQMPGGLVDVQLDASPSTKRSHHLAFFRRNDGVSVKQLEQASDAEFDSLVTYEGGNAQVNAGADMPPIRLYGWIDAGVQRWFTGGNALLGTVAPSEATTFVLGNINLYLDIQPVELHQRTGLVIGSRDDVDLYEAFMRGERKA